MCDDTHVFVLLVHYYTSRWKDSNTAPMIMSSPVKERAVMDIRATVEANSDIADDLLAIHGFSVADAVASFHDIGKATVDKYANKWVKWLTRLGFESMCEPVQPFLYLVFQVAFKTASS